MKIQIDPNRQNRGSILIWSARTSPRFGTARHVAPLESGDVSPHSKSRCCQNSGSAMISVAILALVIGGALATYLLLVSGESQFVNRSQSWNNSMAIAEAGLEEALACVNKNISQSGGLSGWTNTSDGWDTSPSYKTNITWK